MYPLTQIEKSQTWLSLRHIWGYSAILQFSSRHGCSSVLKFFIAMTVFTYIAGLSNSAHGLSRKRCEDLLLKFTSSSDSIDNSRKTSHRMLIATHPEYKPYSGMLLKFADWRVRRSNSSQGTWDITARYHHGPVKLRLRQEGNQELAISVSLPVAGDLDPLMNEVYFLVASTLTEAKMALHIEERNISQVTSPSVTHYVYIPWEADFWLSRVGPTYGFLRPYPEQNELTLKFTELLIAKLEAGEYAGNSDWKPHRSDQDMLQVGKAFVYFRQVPCDRPEFNRVEVVLGSHFIFEFEQEARHSPRMTPTYLGDYDDFGPRLTNEIHRAGLELSPSFPDYFGQKVENPAGYRYTIDLPKKLQTHPVQQVKAAVVSALARFDRR